MGDIIDISEEVRKTHLRDKAAVRIDALGIIKMLFKNINFLNLFCQVVFFNFKIQILKWIFNDLKEGCLIVEIKLYSSLLCLIFVY